MNGAAPTIQHAYDHEPSVSPDTTSDHNTVYQALTGQKMNGQGLGTNHSEIVDDSVAPLSIKRKRATGPSDQHGDLRKRLFGSQQTLDSTVHEDSSEAEVPSTRDQAASPAIPSHVSSLCCAESDVFSEECSNTVVNTTRSPTPEHRPSRLQARPLHLTPLTTAAGLLSPELTDMLKVLYATEKDISIDPNYIAANHGPEVANPNTAVDDYMRREVVAWLVDLSIHFTFQQETLFLAISLFDRFMTAAKAVPCTKLQLVAAACLLVAAKHEEEKHPSVTMMAAMSNHAFQGQDLVRMEAIILSAVSFRVNAPTTHSFLSMMRHATNIKPKLYTIASYFTELALLEGEFLAVPPSWVAAASLAVALVRYSNGGGGRSSGHSAASISDQVESNAAINALRQCVPLPLEHLKPCMQRLLAVASAAGKAGQVQPNGAYGSILYKYRGLVESGTL